MCFIDTIGVIGPNSFPIFPFKFYHNITIGRVRVTVPVAHPERNRVNRLVRDTKSRCDPQRNHKVVVRYR